jgi:capsular exopolysaccharide synthesis family protein
MELRKLLEIIWRRKWIIIQAFLVISVTAVMGSNFIRPTYQASCKVLIEPSEVASALLSNIGVRPSASATTRTMQESAVETSVGLATADPVLNTVISKLQIRDKAGNLLKSGTLRRSGGFLASLFPSPRVIVNQVGDSDLIEMTASSPDPEETAMIAGTVAEVFIEEDLKQRKTEYRYAKTIIETQIHTARSEYLKASEEIKRFRLAEKTVDLEQETTMAIGKIAGLMRSKENIIIGISKTRSKTEVVKSQLGKQNEMFVSTSALTENPQIQVLKKQLLDLELELVEISTKKTSDYPDMVALKEKIKKVREELRREIGIFQASSKDLQILERDLAALEAGLKGVNADIDKQLLLLYGIPEKEFAQSELGIKLSVSQKHYSALLESLYQLGVTEAMTLADIRLLEFPTIPNVDAPTKPNKVKLGIVGIFFGTMFGFGLAFLIDYLDDTIKTPEEAKDKGITLLGTVPRFKRRKRALIHRRGPKDPIAESYRTVRNRLKFAGRDKPIKTLLVASTLHKEGRTTSVANLGISITREGKKVLLMDTDLRRPKLHKMFRVPNSIGITTILEEKAQASEAIQETDVKGLSLLTSGPIPPDPARIIESEKMRQFIQQVTQYYDMVILDSAPVHLTNDAFVLAGYVDGSIIILARGKVKQQAYAQTRELLAQVKIEPIGTILNK